MGLNKQIKALCTPAYLYLVISVILLLLVIGQNLIQGITLNVGGTEFAHNVPIKAGEFGKGWSGFEFDNDNPFDLSIGGIIHPFVLSEYPEFKIMVRTVSGEEIEFVHGSGEYPFFSPSNIQQNNN